jgi:hypothetical protein
VRRAAAPVPATAPRSGDAEPAAERDLPDTLWRRGGIAPRRDADAGAPVDSAGGAALPEYAGLRSDSSDSIDSIPGDSAAIPSAPAPDSGAPGRDGAPAPGPAADTGRPGAP